jgi:hypothetical protein
MLTKLSYTKFILYNTNMNSNIRNLGIIFVTLAMVVGVASMAPVQSVQAEWLDVEDFGCVGVNNCNPETCTDTSAVDVGSAQEQSANINSTSTATSTLTLTPTTPFTCTAGETEDEDIIPGTG